jgi:RNA polymerase sigma-70 factor (ECF subfamily)
VNNAGAEGSHEPPDANGPANSVQALYERHVTAIYRFIYSKVGNREEAEDLTAQVFLKAVRGLDPSRDAASAQSWLFQVARTTIADHWRAFYQLPARSLDDLLDAGWEGPLQGAPVSNPSTVSGERAQAILARLPQRYREVLTYRFLMNYSVRETAIRMGLSEANVKVLQFRALKKASEIELGALGSPTPIPRPSEWEQR